MVVREALHRCGKIGNVSTNRAEIISKMVPDANLQAYVSTAYSKILSGA